MTATRSLLVELQTEELPPKALRALGDTFADALARDLAASEFIAGTPAFTAFATPRRLAVLVRDVRDGSPDREVLVKGPSVKAGLAADGQPAPALLGFAKKQGVPVEQLERQSDGRQDVFVFRSTVRGSTLETVLAAKVSAALKKLPIPKVMRWGDTDHEFVRPVCGLVMLHGERVVPGTVLGQTSGRTTRGHRFLGERSFALAHADDYEAALRDRGKVIARFDARREQIHAQLHAAAGNASIAASAALYDEVAALVEWPAVLEGRFEEAFLAVPQECLVLTMQANQKYFPLLDDQGRLSNRFLIVSNMAIADPSHIIRGNERVVRPRLADAQFFYEQDRKLPLANRLPALASVVYHNRLGSQLDRTHRVAHLAEVIAGLLRADTTAARRAAELAKADLLTGMVGEFPELQGTMGRYYALASGESQGVADAIEAHYRPRFAGDALPGNVVGDCVALADKLDTLVGIHGIGLGPTGDKDPFGLRRAALGALRILIEHRLALDLAELLRLAHDGLSAYALQAGVIDQVFAFMLDRTRSYLRDHDFAPDEIEAVLAQDCRRIDQVLPRIEAVRAFRKLPEAQSLATANKRIGNLLRKSGASATITASLLVEPEEQALHRGLEQLEPAVAEQVAGARYTEALQSLAGVRAQVDAFFDKVLVNADDAALRANRLGLLTRLNRLMNQVADISRLAS